MEQKIYDKYDQPTFPRVTHSRLYLAEDTIQGVVGVLKQLNVVLKTSNAVLCCVDVAFVAIVTWEFCFDGIRK